MSGLAIIPGMEIKSFLDGKIRLYYGNASDVIPEAGPIHSLITDPPYNIGYKYRQHKDNLEWDTYYEWQFRLVEQAANSLVPGGNVLWLNYPEVAATIWYLFLGIPCLHPVKWITWIYHQHTGGKPLRKATRAWLWFSKGKDYYRDDEPLRGEYRNPTDHRIKERMAKGLRPIDYDWWHYEQVKNVSKGKTKHPCQLPLKMVERLVKATCPPDGVVLDTFMGSGTTAEACIRSGRGFVGAENDREYFNIAVDRVEKALSEQLTT